VNQPDPDLRDRIAAALMQWAEANNSPRYASMRRTETVRANAYGRADAVLAVLPADNRTTVLLEAADAVAAERATHIRPGLNHWNPMRLQGMASAEELLRRLADEAQQDPAPGAKERETEEQRADREETERDHAAGDHRYCGQTCEVEFPTEHLRNFVIAKGYPGTKSALAELLRRATVARPGQPETDEEA
jgi:hypothetical protein